MRTQPRPAPPRATAPEFDFGSRDASQHFLFLANRLAKEKGIGFDAAWNRLRTAEPGLWRLANGQPIHDTMLTVASSFLLLNRFAAAKPGEGFAGAWQALCAEYPERVCVATSSGVADESRRNIKNRGSVVPDPAQWKQALAREDEVFDALEAYGAATSSRDRGLQIYRGEVTGLEENFRAAIHRLQAVDGLTLQEAWNRLKTTEPIFWGRFVMIFKA